MKMKIVYAVLKLDPATGRCDPAGSLREYQHLAPDGKTWTSTKCYRTWETKDEAAAFADANLPAGHYQVVPRYDRDAHGEFILIPDDGEQT